MNSLTVAQLHALLLRHDVTDHDVPPGFDPGEERARVIALAAKLGEVTQEQTLIDDQGSRRLGPLYTRVALISRQSLDKIATVHVSAFGRLVTVESDSAEHLVHIMHVIWASPFSYVPPSVLRQPYDGARAAFHGMTWRQRYFELPGKVIA